MNQTPIRLSFQKNSTSLEHVNGQRTTLAMSVSQLADTVLRHDPPTSLEIERAIDHIEEALSGMGVTPKESSELVTNEPLIHSLFGVDTRASSIERDSVEHLFQQLAARARGMPVSAEVVPQGREAAAAVLILRECMHHLGFGKLTLISESA